MSFGLETYDSGAKNRLTLDARCAKLVATVTFSFTLSTAGSAELVKTFVIPGLSGIASLRLVYSYNEEALMYYQTSEVYTLSVSGDTLSVSYSTRSVGVYGFTIYVSIGVWSI